MNCAWNRRAEDGSLNFAANPCTFILFVLELIRVKGYSNCYNSSVWGCCHKYVQMPSCMHSRCCQLWSHKCLADILYSSSRAASLSHCMFVVTRERLYWSLRINLVQISSNISRCSHIYWCYVKFCVWNLVIPTHMQIYSMYVHKLPFYIWNILSYEEKHMKIY